MLRSYLLLMRIRIFDRVALASALLSVFLPFDIVLAKEILTGSLMYFWVRTSSVAVRFRREQAD